MEKFRAYLPKWQNANPQGNALGQMMTLILLPEGQQQQKIAYRVRARIFNKGA